jgi:hypothetical protein
MRTTFSSNGMNVSIRTEKSDKYAEKGFTFGIDGAVVNTCSRLDRIPKVLADSVRGKGLRFPGSASIADCLGGLEDG